MNKRTIKTKLLIAGLLYAAGFSNLQASAPNTTLDPSNITAPTNNPAQDSDPISINIDQDQKKFSIEFTSPITNAADQQAAISRIYDSIATLSAQPDYSSYSMSFKSDSPVSDDMLSQLETKLFTPPTGYEKLPFAIPSNFSFDMPLSADQANHLSELIKNNNPNANVTFNTNEDNNNSHTATLPIPSGQTMSSTFRAPNNDTILQDKIMKGIQTEPTITLKPEQSDLISQMKKSSEESPQ